MSTETSNLTPDEVKQRTRILKRDGWRTEQLAARDGTRYGPMWRHDDHSGWHNLSSAWRLHQDSEVVRTLRARVKKLEKERSELISMLNKGVLARYGREEMDEDEVDWLYYEDIYDPDGWLYILREVLVQIQTEDPTEEQLQLFDVVHRGGSKYKSRLTWGVAEKVYADQWERYNDRDGVFTAITGREHPTQEQASMVADVIQWLGTNCGQAFVHECERRIKQIDEAYRAIEYRDVKSRYNKEHDDRVRAIANGVIQKMAISKCISGVKGKDGKRIQLDEATLAAIKELRELSSVRSFDVPE